MQKGDQNQMGVVSLSVSCDSEGKCSDQRDVWYADSATKRQWVWDAITANAWNGKNYSWPVRTNLCHMHHLMRSHRSIRSLSWVARRIQLTTFLNCVLYRRPFGRHLRPTSHLTLHCRRVRRAPCRRPFNGQSAHSNARGDYRRSD